MSAQPLWRHPERARTTFALLVFVGLTFLFVTGLPPTSKATLGPQEPSDIRKNSKSEFVPGEVLVRYRTEAIAKRQTRLVGETGITSLSAKGREIAVRLERFEGSDIVPGLRIAYVAAEETLAAIESLRQQPNVVYAEPNYLLYADVTNPNDPRFLSNELYGLTKIAAPQAWDTTQGSSTVVVGVIDEGIDRVHQDLQPNIWINPADNTVDGVDNDLNGFIDDINGYNFAANSGTIPADFHGTHVGGTIGAVGNNGIGVVGVNWRVGLMSLKCIAGGTGSTADAIRACNYAKQMRDSWVNSGGTKGANLRVLNNSYGGGGFSQSFLDAINGLNQSAILFVASAGNVGAGATEPNNEIVPHYPSSYLAPNVIGVANTDQNDNLAGSSHFGLTSVHLGAPGSGILSTTPSNNYGLLSGTSMATPHVAGAAALLLAHNPNLTVQQLKSLLIFNGDPAAALLNKTVTGRRLNVSNSFQALAENDVTPPGTVVNLHVNTQTGRSINLGWTASGDDGAAGQASLYQLTFTDATTSAVIPLTNVLPAASGNVQSVDVKLPYRHTAGTVTLREFDNVGNEGTPATLAVFVSLMVGDPYLTSLSSPAGLSTGGTALGLIGDDKLRLNYSLPFTFPFFGENFTAVNISTNGNLFFSAPPTRANGDADDVPSSVVDLAKHKMISGLWDDLRTDRTVGDDVYVTSDPSKIVVRWKGVTFGDGTPATEFPVNFEVELRNDGTISARYGSGNTNIFPVVGIAGGEPDAYSIPSHTSEQVATNLTNAQQVTFLPRGPTTVASLTVASSNPASGVNITVAPSDENSLGDGITQFTRTYQTGAFVNLTAPATASGNEFLKWQRDGVDYATTPATSITLNANRTMTAVYVSPDTSRALTVASSNPSSGVSITVTPNDNGGLSSGTTQFIRTYNQTTVVNLTAPATAGGNNFLKWQRDGIDFATTPATSVTIDTNRTMTAVYVTPRTLTVVSSNPSSGVNITVTPADNGSQGNGATPFTRTYNDGTVVHLTAPATAGGNNFLKWQRNGLDFAATLATSVLIDAGYTMTAVYVTPRTLTVGSRLPDSGVSITVTPNDNGGLSSGTTQFTRTYNEGTTVNLTAPASVVGNPFQKWQRDGVDWATTPATSVTLDAPHTMTAVYVNIVQFSLPQFNAFEPSSFPCTGSPACDGSVTVTVLRSGDSTAPAASVDYTTSDDVATQKGDYIFSAGRLNFAVGELSKSFTVFIVDDIYQEGTESFKVMLSNPVGTTLGFRSVANVLIFDNDGSSAPNPLDNADARFFVRQHYLDFLNREPDAGGLDFWRNQITSCGTDQACIEFKRINVSAAFFLSIEFQETGYFVYKMNKSAYGNLTGAPVPVRYVEFLTDTQQIGKGVIVGVGNWQAQLEANTVAFTQDFVARSAFTTKYPTTKTPAQFVDELFVNAGVTPSPVERTAAINEFSGAPTTADTAARARALRRVAENPTLNQLELNRAFVLMQYFGYLRRNPNDPPEAGLDFGGYNFWLGKLNEFNGNFIKAEMVKAFITSGEYRQRFGP